jgi:hypothetical protein
MSDTESSSAACAKANEEYVPNYATFTDTFMQFPSETNITVLIFGGDPIEVLDAA